MCYVFVVAIIINEFTGHYQQDANTYASWGVECKLCNQVANTFTCYNTVVVKMDWCSTDINGTKLDPKVQYPEMVSIELYNIIMC